MVKSVRGGMKTNFNPNNFSSVAFCSQNRKIAPKTKHENTKKVPIVRSRRRCCDNVMIAIISALVICVGIYVAYRLKLESVLNQPLMNQNTHNKLKLLMITTNATAEKTKMINFFRNLNYDLVDNVNDNWDILWSTRMDTFNLNIDHMTQLKPHQLVNHFPTALSHFMSIESHMFKKHHFKNIVPRAFKLPKMKRELMDYVMVNTHKKFIIKDCLVDDKTQVVSTFDDINYDASLTLQEFTSNPLLIDGRIFEYGIYVLLSSANPLRIYRFKGGISLNFAELDYSQLSKYFCLNQVISASKMPSLSPYRKAGYSIESSIISHLSKNGYNTTILDENIDDAILSFFITNEQSIFNQSKIMFNF